MALPKTVIGIVPDGTTNASFRLWAQNVADLVANSGMLKVPATGEIDFATVATTAGEAGFQIYQFNDALQGTAPVYFRLGYGGTAANAGRPQLYLTVGAGLGAGNATIATVGGAAPTTANSAIGANTNSTNANLVSWACGNASSLVLGLWAGLTQPTVLGYGGPPYANTMLTMTFLSIERTHDANGADTTDGVLIYTQSSAIRTWKQVYWSSTTGMGTADYETTPGMISVQAENKYPGQLGYFGNFFTKVGGVFVGPSLNILHTIQNGPTGAGNYGVQQDNMTIGQIHKVWVANAYHQYVAFTPHVSGNVSTRSLTTNACFMIRYE